MTRALKRERWRPEPPRADEGAISPEDLPPLLEVIGTLDALAGQTGGLTCADFMRQRAPIWKLPPEQQHAAVRELSESEIRADARATIDAVYAGFDWEAATQESVEILRQERQRLKVPARARRKFWFSNPRLSDEHRAILSLAKKGMKLQAIGKALPRPRNPSMMGRLTLQIVWEHLCRGEAPPVHMLHPRRHVNLRYSEDEAVWIAEAFSHLIRKVDEIIAAAKQRLDREAA